MILAIDCSINNTGYAIYRNEDLLFSGVIKTKGETVPEKLKSLFHGMRNQALCHDDIKKAVIEVPGSFSYARSTGKYGKALNQGSLSKLNMAIGVIILACAEWGVEIETIEAHKWKGQRGKKLDKCIAQNIAKRKITSSDESDAIMLGKWYVMQGGSANGKDRNHF